MVQLDTLSVLRIRAHSSRGEHAVRLVLKPRRFVIWVFYFVHLRRVLHMYMCISICKYMSQNNIILYIQRSVFLRCTN